MSWREGCRALAGVGLALLFGWGLAGLDLPLGWLLGALAGGAISANLIGLHGRIKTMRRSGQLLIGAASASVLSQEMLVTLLGLVPLMLGAAVVANLCGFLLAFPFMRLARVDRTTALLASLPAGMAEMASLAADLGARVDVVTITHTIRVFLVVLFVPLLIGVVGDGGSLLQSEAAAGSYLGLALCVLGGMALARIADVFGLLNAYVVVPMGLGVVLVASGLTVAPIPAPLLVLAQVLIGYTLGTRLDAARFAQLPRAALAAALGSVALISAMIFVLAPAVASWADLLPITAALGVAPGGLGEMIAAAKISGAAVGVVAGFQFIRSFLTNMIVPTLLVRGLGRSE